MARSKNAPQAPPMPNQAMAYIWGYIWGYIVKEENVNSCY